MKIPLSQGKFALIDREDYDKVSQYKWYASKRGYACHTLNKGHIRDKELYMHIFILGESPMGKEIDHINRNKLDNRKSNLRFVSRSINMLNQATEGVSYFKWGKRTKRWKAQITINGKNIFLGYHLTRPEAKLAYLAKKEELVAKLG